VGVLFCDVKLVDGFHRTLTIWKTKNDMQKFMLSTIHRKATKIVPRIATGSAIGHEADEMRSWDEALSIWRKLAVNYG
jgi:hypothetical protein